MTSRPDRVAGEPARHSFDPATESEWADLRALGHRMLDEMFEALQGLPDRAVWQEPPANVRDALDQPLPLHGVGPDETYRAFTEHVLPYPNGNWHPRFFGWVQGNGTPLGMLSEMLAAGLNAHLGGFNHAPALVERQTIKWMGEMLGMPGASGLFVTGGSMANTLGLAVGRYAAGKLVGRDVRADGMQHWPGSRPHAPQVFYASDETHAWARKATELLGLGDRAFRRVPVDSAHRIRLDALARQVDADRRAGLSPFCVIGTAGTVNIGATDDLMALADFAQDQSMWFHVDGAFGALAYLSESLRPALRGLGRADSIGFDLHKWGSLPFDCACVLVRDPALHRDAFRASASYLTPATRGVGAGGAMFSDLGPDLTRNFKALKVWMALKAFGVDTLAAIIEQNVAQVRATAERITARETLELLAPVPLNIICFRFRTGDAPDATWDAINTEIMIRLQEQGVAVLSGTTIDGRFALRLANVNHRSTDADFVAVIDAVERIGAEIMQEQVAASA